MFNVSKRLLKFYLQNKSDNLRVSNPPLLIHWVASQPDELNYTHVEMDIKIDIKTHWLLFVKFVSVVFCLLAI